MRKDSLLTEEFFSLHLLSISELEGVQRALAEFESLIKQHIYPHLAEEKEITYYEGRHNLQDLNKFVYQDQASLLQTNNFKLLQTELKLCIIHIRVWAVRNRIEGVDSLFVFLRKMEQPSDSMALLYGDGKRLLEKIAVLLDEPLIAIAERQRIMVNLLADNELEHCIAGCYSRLASTALQLQENLDGKLQIKQWLRSYATLMASQIAAKRPFAMPDTYQVMVCKASDSAAEHNLLHANNYLLMQAKEHGFPIQIVRDQGAIEVGNGLSQLSKKAIIDLYIKDLEQHITAKNLVEYICEKLHASFKTTLSAEGDYADKAAIILNKLNLLGEDSWFKTNKVGLEEILTGNGQLKTVDALQITVTQRLLTRKLLKGYEGKKIGLNRGQSLEYYEFPSVIELTWVWVENRRIPVLELIKADRLPALIPLTHLQASVRHINIIRIIHSFIKDTTSLINVIKNLPASYGEFFVDFLSLQKIAILTKNSDSVRLFIELLTYIPDQAKRRVFLTECGTSFVQKMLFKGLSKANIKQMLPGLAVTYLKEEYNAASKQEALSVTKGLISKLLDNEFTNFANSNFIKLPHDYLEGINFNPKLDSNVNFQSTKFYQPIWHCKFERVGMESVSFFDELLDVSFKNTDLRKVYFNSPINTPYSNIGLENALLSTESFKGLRSAFIVDFVGADFKAVNFQDASIKSRLQFLDFTNTNLESCDLSKLKLNGVVLWEANMAKANLIGADISQISINPQTNLEASYLDLDNVNYLYRRGIKNFAECEIFSNKKSEDDFNHFVFHHTNFKKAKFYGEKLNIDFRNSDVSYALFTKKTNTIVQSMLLSMKTTDSQLNGVSFRDVSFARDSKFLNSQFTFNFVQVEMPVNLAFHLYDLGHLDFLGIKNLIGVMPTKLNAFPLLGAKLNKQTFLYFFNQGLRDFRGGNLNSFNLGQVLVQNRISAIDLLFEGAEFKPFPIGCLSSRRHTRNVLSSPFCTVHYLFQKPNTEKTIFLTDIEVFATVSQERFSLKELVLGTKPLYILSDEVNEVNFYWGYRPDEDVFIKLDSFTKKSIIAFEVSERKNINLRFHFSKKFSDATPLSEFASNIGHLGFSDVKFNYYNQQSQLSMIELKNGIASITTLSVTQQQILHGDKFRALLKDVKLTTLKMYKKEEYRTRLRKITTEVKRKIGAGMRTGVRNGAQYEIGATIIYFIGEAINNPKTADIQLIDAENKTVLKQLAYHLAQEVGQERGASERQINLTTTVAAQCIDRGECSTEAHVIRDVVDSMQRIRPDLMIGNEYAWNNTKEFFVNIGSYVSNKFDEIKQFFTVTRNQSLPTHPSYWGPQTGVFIPSRGIQKRSLYNWYESPLLLQLTKNIEAVFGGFEIDIREDENFSEAMTAGFLSELWQALASCGVNNNATEEFTLSVLKKLENTCFSENFFNSSQRACIAQFTLATATELPTVTTISSRASRSRRRQTRDITSVEKLDFIKKDREIDDAMNLADDYYLQYENRKKYPKGHNNKQNRIIVNPLHKQQRLSEKSNKDLVHEKNFKQKIKSDQKPNVSNKYYNEPYFKEHKHQQAFLSAIKLTKPPMSDIKVQTPPFKKNRLNHLTIADRHPKKIIKSNAENYPLLQKRQPFFRAAPLGIREVTARSEIHTTLFALNFCIKCLNKEKKPIHASRAKVPKLLKMNENTIEIKRNFFIN